MKWYWAIVIYMAGLILGITLLITFNKLLKDEEMKKHIDKSIQKLKDNKDEKI